MAIGSPFGDRGTGTLNRNGFFGDKIAVPGENRPDLSRKVYPVCRHRSLYILREVMQKTGKKNNKVRLKENKTRNKSGSGHRWIVLVTAFSFIISGSLLYALSGIISSINVFVSIIFVLIIILIGIFHTWNPVSWWSAFYVGQKAVMALI